MYMDMCVLKNMITLLFHLNLYSFMKEYKMIEAYKRSIYYF